MSTQPSFPQKQNQVHQILTSDNSFIEPNIRKAKFIRSTTRYYTLEFDQNIQMSELKLMIQKAAHLRKNSFMLFSEGQNYTQCNEETFESLFPGKELVIFTLELINTEDTQEESELLLQMNMPCPDHNYKFLLYYCFTCGKSICSECFTNGIHKGHIIQDKCFYLLPSKYLVEKMFDNWSQNPYDEFQISVDLNAYKEQLNKKIFNELIQLLLQIQAKCNNLIDKYNQINQKSLTNIRDSVRDIKVFCIRALDDYKKAINIKEIINNDEMFIDFDNTYKEIGRQQKEKFKENIHNFQELNKSISLLVQNLINNICQKLHNTLLEVVNSKQYEDIETQINLKLIKPFDKVQIMNQISDKKNKKYKKHERRSLPDYKNVGNNNLSEGISDSDKNINKEQYIDINKGRNTMILESHINKNNDVSNSLNKSDNDNMMDLSNSNNSNDNVKINTNINLNNNINTNIINNTNNINPNNLASNGRSDRIVTFNDLLKNQTNYNINSNVNNNNLSIDSNLITPTADRKMESNNLANMTHTHNHSHIHLLNNNNNIPPTNISLKTIIQPNNDISKYFNKKQNEMTQTNINQIISNNTNILPNETIYQKDAKVNNNEQNGININIKRQSKEKHIPNVYTAIIEGQNNNMKNINDNNIFNFTSNEKGNNLININSMKGISPIQENRAFNQSNINMSNNSSFNHDINNFNNATLAHKEKEEFSNPFVIDSANNNSSKRDILLVNTNNNNIKNHQMSIIPTKVNSSLPLSSPFSTFLKKDTNYNNNNNNNLWTNTNININSGINNNNNINQANKTPFGLYMKEMQTNTIINTNNINEPNNTNINSKNIINNNINSNNIINSNINVQSQTQIQNETISHPVQNNNTNLVSVLAGKIMDTKNELDNKYLAITKQNFNPIDEESFESESGLKQKNKEKKNININLYLNKSFILCPIPGTNQLKLITDDESDECTLSVTFPKNIGLSYFLKDCAYCNHDKKLYITGGTMENDNITASSNKLFVIDLFQKNIEGKNSFITELHPMTYSKSKHSMIYYEDKLYVVGGENDDTVEKYDIKNNVWEELNPLIRSRSFPILFIYEGCLYAFLGKDKEDYLIDAERLNLNEENPSWEIVVFNNPENVDVRIYGCGLYQVDELIYFFGGKRMGQNTNEIFFINMKERTINRSDAKLKWKESFRENTLFQLGNKLVQISDEKYFGTYLNVVVQ